jgi:hypothetical protein
MRLSPTQVQRIQVEMNAEAIPEQHAITPDLQRAFGDHTFFLDGDGLNIVEASSEDSHVGNVVKVAGWADADHTTLKIQTPQPTPLQVELDREDDRGERIG